MGGIARARVPCLAVILAGLTLSLCAASQAGAVRTEYFGISHGTRLDSQDLQGMVAARVRTDRFLFQWRTVQPVPGSFDWSQPDKVIGSLARHGIRTVPFAWGSPLWVRPGPSRPPVNTTVAQTAWKSFLRAAVARYGPGGSYWANGYRQRYGANATPYPITSWQIWNEPNLKKYFDPGRTTAHGVNQYAQLVKISHEAIKSRDPQARVVLAGMYGNGSVTAWDYLRGLYKISGFKSDFDVAALHPYSIDLDGFRRQIVQFRAVMTNQGDGATPLWISEFGWGSAPADGLRLTKGLAGQGQILTDSFRMVLGNRSAWNLQRLFWYHWRDPPEDEATCNFCATAGLLQLDRTMKPAYYAFTDFTAETTPPQASITGGPSQGGVTNNTTPRFSFTSNEPGSTFVCRVDGRPYTGCSSPYATPRLSDGNHAFFVKAIDAPGNESEVVWRSFTVDTLAPPVPTITDVDPNSPANDNAPEVKGTAAAGTTVKLHKTASCANGTAVAQGSRAQFASPGITATVADNTTTAFRARAIDAAGNASECSGSYNYVEDSTP